MTSQFRTWVVYALLTNGSSEKIAQTRKIAQTSMICGEDVRENRSNDAPYVYVELVDTNGTTYEPEAISFADWRDYGCHYALPDEYARGEFGALSVYRLHGIGVTPCSRGISWMIRMMCQVFLICVSATHPNRPSIWPENGMLLL